MPPSCGAAWTAMRLTAFGLLVLAGGTALAQQPQQFPAGSVPLGVAFDRAHNQLVVTNSGDNSVSAVNLSSQQLRTVASVNSPAGVAVDGDLGLAVVANSVSNSVTVIDLDQNRIAATIPVESSPFSVDINTTTHIAVVSNSQSSSLSLVDLSTLRVTATIPNVPVQSRSVQAVAVHSGSNVAVAVNTSLNSVTLVDLANRRVTDTVSVGQVPFAVAINPSTNVAVVTNSGGNSVSIVNLATRQATEIPISASPQGLAIHVPSNTAAISSTLTNEVFFLDLTTNQVASSVSSLAGAAAAAADQAGRRVAVVLPPNNSAALIAVPLPNRFNVVSQAGLQAGSLTAGAIATGFGDGLGAALQAASSLPLPTQLGDIKVRVRTVDAPLFQVSPTQITFQVPSGLTGRQTVQVLRKGVPAGSPDVVVAVGEINIDFASPALFTQSLTGSGPVLAINEDGSPVSADGCVPGGKPAAPGSLVQLFGTGEGPLTPSVPDGQPAPSSPPALTSTRPAVNLAGVSLNVEFSGAVPNFVGLWQINVRIPDRPPSGAALPLVVTIQGRSSPAGATLAVNTSIQACKAETNRVTVVSAASFLGGPLGRGSLVSGFGVGLAAEAQGASSLPLPTKLGETTLRVGTIDVPLLFVSPTQINFQVPSKLIGPQPFQVLRNGVAVATGTLAVGGASPALFARASGSLLAVNQDGSPVTADGCVEGAKPAAPGSLISLFGTGEGPLTPALTDGQAAPVRPLSVTVTQPEVTFRDASLGDVPVRVEFSGAAPNLVGLWQINIRIPQIPPSGAAVPVKVSIRGSATAAFTTLAVNTNVQPCAP